MQRGRDKRRRKRTSPLKLGRPLWRGEDPSILLLLVVEDNRGKPPERWLLRNDTCVHTKRGPKWVVLASPPPPLPPSKGKPSSPCGFLRIVGVDRINIPWELGISLGVHRLIRRPRFCRMIASKVRGVPLLHFANRGKH